MNPIRYGLNTPALDRLKVMHFNVVFAHAQVTEAASVPRNLVTSGRLRTLPPFFLSSFYLPLSLFLR